MKKRRKGNFPQKMMAFLLSAALIAGVNPAPVLAKESVSGNSVEITEGAPGAESSGKEIETEETVPEDTGEAAPENTGETVPEDAKETVTEEQESESEQTPEETVTEEEEPESADENNAQPATVAESEIVQVVEDAKSTDGLIDSGTDWTLDADGRLTIQSDAGMEDWYSVGKKNDEKVVSVEIQAGVTSIEDSAFCGCSNLASIMIPVGVTRIGDHAFQWCFRLVSIMLPDSVTSIGNYVFEGCSSLASITLPDSVTSIGDNAFSSCHSLTSIRLPSGVTSIGNYMFEGCDCLISITIPDHVTSIGNYVFSNCSNLKNIAFPSGVTSIGDNAFQWCRSLTGITIPDSVTSIGEKAFEGCSNLKSVIMQGIVPPTLGVADRDTGKTYVFSSCLFVKYNAKNIKVPLGTVEAYKEAWTEWADYITSAGELVGGFIASGTDWTLDADGKLVIQSDEGMEDWCSQIIDEEHIQNKNVEIVEIQDGVTEIGDFAFNACSFLTSAILPVSLTSIGKHAFLNCDNLKEVTFPSGVVSIGKNAFGGCNSLINIMLPDNLTKIEEGVFSNCSNLISITISSDVTSIEKNAFDGCSRLESVTVQGTTPPTLGNAGESYIFRSCKFVTDNAKGIKVPSGTAEAYKEIWAEWADYITDFVAFGTDWTLDDNGKLTIQSNTGEVQWWNVGKGNYVDKVISVEIQAGVTDIWNSAFSSCSNLTSITIPDSVTSIEDKAFAGCSSLTNIVLPDDLASIEDEVFLGCSSLTGIELPDNVTSIGDQAFRNCSSLTGIELPDNVTSIGDQAFRDCSSLKSITIPPGVTSMGYQVFYWCSSLTSIELPSCMTSIRTREFEQCSSLTDIMIPSSVTSIGSFAFLNCSSLTDIMIPDSVTSIGDQAFDGCTSLKSITIPAGVTSIGWAAFYDCSSLIKVTMLGTLPLQTSGSLFSYCKFETDNVEGIKVPTGTVEAYEAAWDEWKNYITDNPADDLIASGTDWTLDMDGKLTLQSGAVTGGKIGNHREQVISAEIKAGVTSIGNDAFRSCSGLTSITIPDSVTSIGNGAFRSCSGLTSITIPDSVTSIGYDAFRNCSGLTSITIPDSVTSIGYGAFRYCRSLTDIMLPSGVTSIRESLFYSCSNLTSITIPSGVTSIGYDAFRHCGNLTSIVIPSGVTNIGSFAFSDCSSLTDVTISVGVTRIANEGFSGCDSLTNITIPGSVTSIGDQAFRDCSSLEFVTMLGITPPTLEETEIEIVETHEFDGCKFVTNNTKGIKVPTGTAETYKAAWIKWADYITDGSAPTDNEKVFVAKQAVEAALPGIQVTNDATPESLVAAIKDAVKSALEEAGVSSDDITITVEKFVKTDATIKAEGSVSADIRVASGTESASVLLNKTIGKLPFTPANKVAAAKAAVEDNVKRALEAALAGTTVTNENAEETAAKIAGIIPDAAARALTEAGVSADEIAVGEAVIEVKQAAADSEGKIHVTILITSKEDPGQSASAAVQIPVTMPDVGGDDDRDTEAAQKMVDDALKGITAANETTKEDILAALREELGDKAVVNGIEKFEKVDATAEAPGSISLDIKLTINGKTVIISAAVHIAQLGRKTGMHIRFTDYYDLAGDTPRYKYTGMAVKPSVEIYNNDTLLVPGKDYTVGYQNNTKVGSMAALIVKGKGNFSGTSNVVNFTIFNADIDKDTEHPVEMTVIVNTKVSPVIMNGTKKLTTKDYQLEGEGLVNGKYAAATAEGQPNTLTVKGIGSYEGSSFAIKVRVIEMSTARKFAVTVDKNFKPVFCGSVWNLSGLFRSADNADGAIAVTDSKDKTKLLREGIDFTVLCTSSLLHAGTVNFTLTGMGEYTGNVSKTFRINPLKVTDSSKFSVTFDEGKAYEYKASGATVDNLVVKYLGETNAAEDDKILIQGVDYKVAYTNNKKVSGKRDAGLKVTFLGDYKGSTAVSKTFKIIPAKLSTANTAVIVPDKVYSKADRAYKSTPIVTVDGAAVKASNYTVSYAWATESEAGDEAKYVSDNKVKITIAEGDSWAKVNVTVIPKETGSYGLAEGTVLKGEYYVRKTDNAIDLSRAKVTFFNKAGTQLKTLEYNGNPFYTPVGNNSDVNNAPEDPNAVYVRAAVGSAVVDPGLYEVIWTDAAEKGRATVVIRGKGAATEKGMAVGSKNQTIGIKAMALKGKNLKY